MILIIPTIPIFHGICASQIAARGGVSEAIYSESPLDRARLLRKENAKTIHLEFWEEAPWSVDGLSMLRQMREVVDIPFELSLRELPESPSFLAPMFEAGVYRVFLPLGADREVVFSYIEAYGARKIIPTVDHHFDFKHHLADLKAHKIERLAIEISPADELEDAIIDWDELKEFAESAKQSGIRLTAQHGVRGYPDLKEIQELGVALDSLVLNRALNENRFPCQLIWREVEAEYASETGPDTNLWTNPLEGKPHL